MALNLWKPSAKEAAQLRVIPKKEAAKKESGNKNPNQGKQNKRQEVILSGRARKAAQQEVKKRGHKSVGGLSNITLCEIITGEKVGKKGAINLLKEWYLSLDGMEKANLSKAAKKDKANKKGLSDKPKRYIDDVKPHVVKKKYSHPELGKKGYTDFYQSKGWRQLRYLALKNTNGSCQCCGAKASDGIQLHVDHIRPRSRYPELELSLDNLQVLCQDCNVGKGDWDITDWKQHFKSI